MVLLNVSAAAQQRMNKVCENDEWRRQAESAISMVFTFLATDQYCASSSTNVRVGMHMCVSHPIMHFIFYLVKLSAVANS